MNDSNFFLSAAVLAGGASSRMGRNKSLLELNGERMIERVVARLEQSSDDVMVVTNDFATYPFLAERVRFVADVGGAGQGPLAGIAAAVNAARHDRVLVVATDMPFLNVALIRYLAMLDPLADVVVPVISEDGFPETLHAIYHKRALPAITAQLAAGRRKITHFFREVRVVTVPRPDVQRYDPDLRSFFNANTPDEWAAAVEQSGEG